MKIFSFILHFHFLPIVLLTMEQYKLIFDLFSSFFYLKFRCSSYLLHFMVIQHFLAELSRIMCLTMYLCELSLHWRFLWTGRMGIWVGRIFWFRKTKIAITFEQKRISTYIFFKTGSFLRHCTIKELPKLPSPSFKTCPNHASHKDIFSEWSNLFR